MKNLAIALALATAPLTACTTTSNIPDVPVVGELCTAADRTLIDEKVVFSAKTLYNIASVAYLEAVDDGHLPPGALRTSLRDKVIKLKSLENGIEAARGTVNCDFSAMKTLHTEILTLIPRSN